MTDLTNKERLIELKGLVIGLDKNFQEFKNDSKEDDVRKWKQINRNAQNISGMRGMTVGIAFIVSILANVGAYFGVIKQ